MKRRALSAFVLLFLVLISHVTDARKDPGDYWRSMMDDEPMPKAITDLFDQNNVGQKDRFFRDFDVKPNVIIYHSHHHHHDGEKSKASAMEHMRIK